MVVTSFIAVVCSGIASLKWRTSSTRPNEVQPCEPCITGMQASRPMNAKLAPSGWLILSGLTAQAFFDSTTLAMMVFRAQAGTWSGSRPIALAAMPGSKPIPRTAPSVSPSSPQGAGMRTCCHTGLKIARSISCTSSTMPS